MVLPVVTRGPDIQAKGMVIRPYNRIYTRLAQMQMKLFRPIDGMWCHYRPIDERVVIIKLYLSCLVAASENTAIGRPSCMVFSPLLYIGV